MAAINVVSPAAIGVRVNAMTRDSERGIGVALTGTSNCVFLNGLSSGLSGHPKVRKFMNKSQGASGTVAIAAHLRDFDLSDFDYVFIEYCVNESYMLASGMEKIANTHRHISAMVDHAAGHGCIPILVNFPTIHSLRRPVPMQEMLEREFVSRGVPFFDVQRLLLQRSKARGIDIQTCFHDPRHIHRPIAFALGTMMIDAIERAREAQAIHEVSTPTDAAFGSIGFVPAGNFRSSEATLLRRSNRLLSAELLSFSPDQTATLSSLNGVPYSIHGAAYNAARTLGRLVTEDGGVIIDVKRTRFFGTDRDLSIVNIPSPAPDTVVDADMRILYEGAEPLDEDRSPMAFELAGLAMHYANMQSPLRVVFVEEDRRGLHKTVTPEDLLQLDHAWDAILYNSQMRTGDAPA